MGHPDSGTALQVQKNERFDDMVIGGKGYNNDEREKRVGEKMDPWHQTEVNFKGGHLVYRIDPDMSGVFPDPVTDPNRNPSLAEQKYDVWTSENHDASDMKDWREKSPKAYMV